ncbi:MAG: xanthine dehydrogenase family protein [Deltaproteobacteria bacterium]|nr:xanthine dehydrogenase family protein [Deltaproteobacteria bacterium]
MGEVRRHKRHSEGALHIGASTPRADAYAKVTGAEKFAADYYSSDMVWAGVKRGAAPHGVIKGIFTDEACKAPGVIAVLTHRDIRGSNRQGVVRKDQPVLADKKVRHCGDAVALVLAEDRETLLRALDLIRLDLEALPGVFDVEEALKDGAPLVHEDNAGGNTLLEAHIQTGDGLTAFERCDEVIEGRFETPWQEHAYLETEVGWAQQQNDGKVVIVASTQTPFRDRAEVAEAIGLDLEQVRVIAPYTGGAFGGKDGITVQTLLALAALHSNGRPVKMWWEREESFIAGTKRHPTRLYYRLGAKGDGVLHALAARLYFDTGPYDHLGGVVMTLALEHAGGAYRIPHALLDAWCVYTNNPIGGAFRAFGVTQVTAAMEQMMDMLAARLDMDPLELRLKNALTRGEKTCVGVTLTGSTGLVECLERVERHPLRTERYAWKAAAGPFKRRGVGIAALMHAAGYGTVVPDYANAKIELTPEGKIRIYCGVVDMGQGNASANAQIAGSILNQNMDSMELVLPDTDRTLPSGSASASRCTYTFGNALIGAAEILKNRILQKAADLLMAPSTDDLTLAPGKVVNRATGAQIPLSRLGRLMAESERTAISHFRAPVAKDRLDVTDELRLHGLGHAVISYGAHLAAVEVDEITGAVEVVSYLSATDCGRALNPQIYEQQIHGGICQGLGFALFEDFRVEQGTVKSPDLATYIIPTAPDTPNMESLPVELHEPTGPFGLKGVGEIATNGPAPAVANALADACGIRMFRLPMTPERVLLALRGRETR